MMIDAYASDNLQRCIKLIISSPYGSPTWRQKIYPLSNYYYGPDSQSWLG